MSRQVLVVASQRRLELSFFVFGCPIWLDNWPGTGTQRPGTTCHGGRVAACAKALALEKLVGLRQQFHALFEVAPDATWLHKQLTTWVKEAHMLALFVLAPFLKTLANWQEHIANFAESWLTNAATEGLNNIIRYGKRTSFGLLDFDRTYAPNFG